MKFGLLPAETEDRGPKQDSWRVMYRIVDLGGASRGAFYSKNLYTVQRLRKTIGLLP